MDDTKTDVAEREHNMSKLANQMETSKVAPAVGLMTCMTKAGV